MPNETLITEIENMLSQIVRLGGENERTSIVPNLTVVNANPSGLTGFVIVSDDRDGDNILAKTVPGVIYNNNDLVNVMFVKGGEAIAFQQGSQSPSSGLWSIVPSTSTDIYYNAGDVGIGKAVAPDARLELLDTAQAQLRLTYQEDTKFADLTIDTNHDLTIDPSSTGQIILASDDITVGEDIIHSGDTDTKIILTTDKISFDAGALNMLALTETTQDLVEIGDVAGAGDVDINFSSGQAFLRGSDGFLGVGTTSPSFLIHALANANSAQRIGIENTNAGSSAQALFDAKADGTPRFQTGITSTTSVATLVGGNRAFFQANGTDLIIRTVSATGYMVFAGGAAGTTEIVRMQSDQNVGFAVTSPQGQIHAYNSISGFLIWEYDGLNATVRTIVPNGTGDCLYRLHAAYVLRDSAAAVASGTTDVSNSASVNLTVGTNTVRLRVNADGSIDIARTAGSDTIKVALTLRWL